jgi:hypothetical protein
MCGPFVIAHSIDILTPPPGLQRSLALPDGATPRGFMRPQPNVLTKLLAMLIISLKLRLLKNIISKLLAKIKSVSVMLSDFSEISYKNDVRP